MADPQTIREVDDKAERATLAFTLGRFTEYFEAEGNAAIKRLTSRYAELGGDTGERPDADNPGPGG